MASNDTTDGVSRRPLPLQIPKNNAPSASMLGDVTTTDPSTSPLTGAAAAAAIAAAASGSDTLPATSSQPPPTVAPLGKRSQSKQAKQLQQQQQQQAEETDDEDEGPDDKDDRRPWVPWEDEKVRELVAKFGTKRWSNVGSYLPGRTGKQCRERLVFTVDMRFRPFSMNVDLFLYLPA